MILHKQAIMTLPDHVFIYTIYSMLLLNTTDNIIFHIIIISNILFLFNYFIINLLFSYYKRNKVNRLIKSCMFYLTETYLRCN
jgi:hypothetical protein